MSNSRGAMLDEFLPVCIGPVLRDLEFRQLARLRWRRGNVFEVRAVLDSKAKDPYRGGAFNLEFEASLDGKFGGKITGTARLEQLLDGGQQELFVAVRNEIAGRLSVPPDSYLAQLPEFLLAELSSPVQALRRDGPSVLDEVPDARGPCCVVPLLACCASGGCRSPRVA